MSLSGRRRRIPYGALFLILVPVLVIACGVTLDAEDEASETFRDVTVTSLSPGPLVAGTELQLTVNYAQPYPAQLDIECDLLAADGAKVRDLHVEAIPANSAANIPTEVDENFAAETTPLLGTFGPRFFAPEMPGTYIVHCFTQEDTNNEIERVIRIVAVATPSSPAGESP